MTRKLLSGVLAFAMVFGCTAPVALAEDTTVEEVEQYTVYAPSLSKDTVELLHEDGHIVVRVTNDVAVDSTNGGSAHAESAAQTATDAQGIGLHTLQARAESIGATLRTATSHGQHTVELTL